MGSISCKVQNDLEGSLIIYKREEICIRVSYKLCAYRIHIVGSETFEGLFFEKF